MNTEVAPRQNRSRLGTDYRWQKKQEADTRSLILEDCVEAEKRAGLTVWARENMRDLVAKGLVILPAGKTVEDLPVYRGPQPEPERHWQPKHDWRGIAERILSHLRSGTVKTINQASKLMGISSHTCYAAWNRWGPEDWQAEGRRFARWPLNEMTKDEGSLQTATSHE